MKIIMIISFALGMFILSTNSFADGEMSTMKSTEEQKQSTKTVKKSRRKKAMMCNECGKPETECDCEGHKDGEEGHEDH